MSLTVRGCKVVCLLIYNCEKCVGFSLGKEPWPIGNELKWWECGWDPGEDPGSLLGGKGGGDASLWFINESRGGSIGASGACLICKNRCIKATLESSGSWHNKSKVPCEIDMIAGHSVYLDMRLNLLVVASLSLDYPFFSSAEEVVVEVEALEVTSG